MARVRALHGKTFERARLQAAQNKVSKRRGFLAAEVNYE
jgi:hypothetical protein